MADKNIVIQRNNAGTIDNIYPQTQWGNVLNKPTTFTPTSHTHGNITNAGGFNNSPVGIASGDSFVILDSGLISHSTLTFGSGTTTFLRNDGTWGTPAGSGVSGSGTTNELTYWTGASTLGTLSTATYPSLTELSRVKGVTSAIQTQIDAKADSTQFVDTFKATSTTANSTTAVSYHTVTLLPGHYYELQVTGIWSKTATTNSVGATINMICNSLTGSPTFHGVFEWLQNTTATAYTIENNVLNLVTSGNTLAFTTTATTAAVGGTFWGMKGLIYTGTTDNKTLTFQIATSAAPSTGTVALDRIAITAERLS